MQPSGERMDENFNMYTPNTGASKFIKQILMPKTYLREKTVSLTNGRKRNNLDLSLSLFKTQLQMDQVP